MTTPKTPLEKARAALRAELTISMTTRAVGGTP